MMKFTILLDVETEDSEKLESRLFDVLSSLKGVTNVRRSEFPVDRLIASLEWASHQFLEKAELLKNRDF